MYSNADAKHCGNNKQVHRVALPLFSFSENSKIVSLPLEFAYLPVDILAKEFTKLNSPHEHRIHYLGPRYANTQALHKKCAYSELSQLCPGVPDRSINKYRMEVKRIANSFFINVPTYLTLGKTPHQPFLQNRTVLPRIWRHESHPGPKQWAYLQRRIRVR